MGVPPKRPKAPKGEKGGAGEGPVPEAQVAKACRALKAWLGSAAAAGEKQPLFEDDGEMLYLQVALKRIPAVRKDKPIRIAIPHSLYEVDGAEVCLIVKDKKGAGAKGAKERLRQEARTGVTKVLGVSKLKTKFESHEAKRKLSQAYDLFLADAAVLPVLPQLLGKAFFRKKKQPIPVALHGKKDWKAQIRRACDATYAYLGGGTCVNIRVARSSFADEAVVENVLAAIAALPGVLPGKWRSVQALYLKSAESVALPLYTELPDQ